MGTPGHSGEGPLTGDSRVKLQFFPGAWWEHLTGESLVKCSKKWSGSCTTPLILSEKTIPPKKKAIAPGSRRAAASAAADNPRLSRRLGAEANLKFF